MKNVKKHFKILGYPVKDKITGFSGVATCISFDLYGCIQIAINPGVGKDEKLGDSHWFDVNRLEIKSNKRVMELPNFDFGPIAEGMHGPSEKPKKI